jgi:hypothetical protein
VIKTCFQTAIKTCFPQHESAKAYDFVVSRYAA